jgi:hypothetical protein
VTTAWSEVREARLRLAVAAGKSDATIAATLGVTPRAVNGKRWRLGLRTPRGDVLAAALARAAKLRAREAPP